MENYFVEFARNAANGSPIAAYLFFFFNSILQVLFPPYPGDSIIALQGYLSTKGILNPYILLTNIFIATYLSSLFLYIVSFKYGEAVINKSIIKNYFDINKINRLEDWFRKYGAIIIIINKFLPGLGSLTFIATGLFKLPRIPAMISIGVACILHNIVLFIGGRIAGENTKIIKNFIREYSIYIILGIIIIGLIYIIIKKLWGKHPRSK